jgi:hypothetical protein
MSPEQKNIPKNPRSTVVNQEIVVLDFLFFIVLFRKFILHQKLGSSSQCTQNSKDFLIV